MVPQGLLGFKPSTSGGGFIANPDGYTKKEHRSTEKLGWLASLTTMPKKQLQGTCVASFFQFQVASTSTRKSDFTDVTQKQLFQKTSHTVEYLSLPTCVQWIRQPGLPLQKLEDRHRFHEAVDEARRNAVDAGSMDEVTEGRENFCSVIKNII